jgi:hypothetical protein
MGLQDELDAYDRYVTCITIIDTIIHHILTIYTNNAYIYDTQPPQRARREVGCENSTAD